MGHDSCFVAVHFGAGYHSVSKEADYKKLMKRCCIETQKHLQNTDNLIDALVIGIKILEDSGLVNAGSGSNTNINGIIQSDASIMQLNPPCIGAVGCVSGTKNPIDCARIAFQKANDSGTMSSVIYGGVINSINSDYRSKSSSLETCFSNSDTVGIICINSKGQMAMACSSGGPEGKSDGRIGPCAIPGSGFWGVFHENLSCASLFTGIGEQIIIKGGARLITDRIISSSMDLDDSEFLRKLYSSFDGSKKLEFGFISISISKDVIEIFASHSTSSFIFGWKLGNKLAKIKISRLDKEFFKSFATCLQIK